MPVYQYSLYRASDTANGSGWLNASIGSYNIVGTPSSPGPVPTAFDTQLKPGSLLFVLGQVLAVATISDSSHLTVQSPIQVVLSNNAFTYNNLVNVETLATPAFAPKSVPKPWYQGVDTGDGLARGMGRPVTSWQFGYVTQAFRNALRLFCTGKSARVYVRSREIDNSDDFITYQGAMLWPDLENREATRRISFSVDFRDLVIV